jgi:transcriptional regulator with XRE-family HTH domain
LNETLRRALLRAGLNEDDVAAHMAVDPKTVRRWTEGRVPYLRHRWELAQLLGCDETDLWPMASPTRSRPEDVYAIYPRRDRVPSEVWLNMFASAERDIGILANTGLFIASQPAVLAALEERAQASVRLRICLRDSAAPFPADDAQPALGRKLPPRIEAALAKYGALRAHGPAEIRLHRAVLSNSIYRADDELLVSQHAYGIAPGRRPVLHLRRAENEMIIQYLDAFNRLWAGAQPLG